MHIQGDLQTVFDALYDLGVIEPMLSKDWRSGLVEVDTRSPGLLRAIKLVNSIGANRRELFTQLGKLDRSVLEILAMEVAREYADFATNKETWEETRETLH